MDESCRIDEDEQSTYLPACALWMSWAPGRLQNALRPYLTNYQGHAIGRPTKMFKAQAERVWFRPTAASCVPALIAWSCLSFFGCGERLSDQDDQLQKEIQAEAGARLQPSREAAQLSVNHREEPWSVNPKRYIHPGGQVGYDGPTRRIFAVDLNGCRVDREFLLKLERLPALKELSLADSSINDEGLEVVGRLSNLQYLDVSFTDITDAGLKALDNLPKLQVYWLNWCKVTDDGLASIEKLKAITDLRLGSCTEIGDAGIAHLDGLSELAEIHLDDTRVSDKAMAGLGGHLKLRTIWLDETSVGDAGIKDLSQLPHLQALHLAECQGVTDLGIGYLTCHRDLKWLDIAGTSVTDECIKDLSTLKGLKQLFVGQTTITAAGRAKLRKTLGTVVFPLN